MEQTMRSNKRYINLFISHMTMVVINTAFQPSPCLANLTKITDRAMNKLNTPPILRKRVFGEIILLTGLKQILNPRYERILDSFIYLFTQMKSNQCRCDTFLLINARQQSHLLRIISKYFVKYYWEVLQDNTVDLKKALTHSVPCKYIIKNHQCFLMLN